VAKPKVEQLELDLFADPTQRPHPNYVHEDLAEAINQVMQGNTGAARRWLVSQSPRDRYRIRVAMRILILHSASLDGDPSAKELLK
jgi:hypothetical protein